MKPNSIVENLRNLKSLKVLKIETLRKNEESFVRQKIGNLELRFLMEVWKNEKDEKFKEDLRIYYFSSVNDVIKSLKI